MAKQREVARWITVNGNHVPVFEGESKADAVKRAIGKNDSTGTEKKSAEKKEEKPDWIADWDPIPDDPKEERKKRLAREKADEDDAYDKEHGEGKYSTLNTKTKSKKSSTKSSKDNEDHYDTKLNDIRERMRSGKITPDQAKDEAFEYEKSQRTNKKWNDVDRNRMESKVQDIFDEADKKPAKKSSIQKQISKDLDTKEKQIAANEEKIDRLERELNVEMSSKDSKHSVGWRREMRDKISKLRDENAELKYGKNSARSESAKRRAQIDKDNDTKEKQIAQHQKEVDKLNGKTTSKGLDNYLKKHNLSMDEVYKEIKNNPKMKATANELLKDGMEYDQASAMAYEQHMNKNGKGTSRSTTMSPAAKKITRGVELARKQLNFDRPGDYAEISDRHWFGRLGVSNERMAEMMSAQDPKYDYEYQAETVPHKTLGKVTHHRMYRVPKEGTKATTMADLKKQALAAGYSKEKIQGMTKAQLKKLLG